MNRLMGSPAAGFRDECEVPESMKLTAGPGRARGRQAREREGHEGRRWQRLAGVKAGGVAAGKGATREAEAPCGSPYPLS